MASLGRRQYPWKRQSLVLLTLLLRGAAPECIDSPKVNWTGVREDLVTYTTLAEPVMRSRRCFGLDQGIWSYCGISAMNILQMQPGLINSREPAEDLQVQSPCALGQVAISFFTMIFLTAGERHGLLFGAGDRFDRLHLSFGALLDTGWPIFGVLARLSEVVLLSGQARPVDATCVGSAGAGSAAVQQLHALREELGQRLSQRRAVPEALARRILAAVERIEPAEGRDEELPSAGCAAATAAAWACLAEAAHWRSDVAAASAYLQRSDAAFRSVKSNYTALDWVSTQWPIFKLLHRLQFRLLPDEAVKHEDGFWMQADLVPHDPDNSRPMRFAFNRAFVRPDALYIDVAADIVHTDMLRTLPAFFGMQAARPSDKWNINLVYTSSDYVDLVPKNDLWRLRAGSQRLLFVPQVQDVLGEKDQQCRAYFDALEGWKVSDRLENEVGGMPRCFDMPSAAEELRTFAASQGQTGERRLAFVRKPEGAWGGRGIEIRFGLKGMLGGNANSDDTSQIGSTCNFIPLEDVQCIGLQSAASPASSASASACREACCDMGRKACEAWNWRDDEGCWVGIPRYCSQPNPVFLGGWRGGHRPRGSNVDAEASDPGATQRAVVQQYILDPVLYQLEGVHPPIRVKTDIRIYGTVVSLDPFRLYISEYGYFRSGFLEKNYSAASDDDFKDPLMHITHHIPKIEAGSYQCATGPSWGHPKGAEHDAGSGGSLHKWFKIAKEQNGLDPKVVWKNIKMALSVFLLGSRNKLSCENNRVPHACGSAAFHFFADLVVDSRGRAWLMEIHPTFAVKSPGLGDPEAGWVEVLTRSTRQGSLGTLAMLFTGWADAPYRSWAEKLLKARLLWQPRWKSAVKHLRQLLKEQRARMPGWSGEAASLPGLLARVLVEEHLACRLAVQQVLPAHWREVAEYIGAAPDASDDSDPFRGGLRPFYRLLEAARHVVRRARAKLPGGAIPGDLRARSCEPVDFNLGTRWDQPWERSSRRFKL